MRKSDQGKDLYKKTVARHKQTYPGLEINTTIATVGCHDGILLPSLVSALVLIVSTLVLIVSTLVLIVSSLVLIVSTLVLI